MSARALAGATIAIVMLTAPARAAVLDRAVARFYDPEAGASGGRRFVYMRELVLQAWLESYERSTDEVAAPDDKIARAALERQVVEELLATRPLPPALEAKVAAATKTARTVLEARVGGAARLEEAIGRASGKPVAEDSVRRDVEAILRRRARAELYLELAIVQPIEVTDGEVRAGWLKAPASSRRPYAEFAPPFRATIRATRLRETAQAYYSVVRSRLRLELIPDG